MAGWRGKSIIDLFFFKRTIRDWMLRKVEAYSWPSFVKEGFRSYLVDVNVCRANLGYMADQTEFQVDTTERATWPESADKFLLAAEALVFGYQHDLSEIKILAQKRGVEDLMDLSETAHFMKGVEDCHKKERHRTK